MIPQALDPSIQRILLALAGGGTPAERLPFALSPTTPGFQNFLAFGPFVPKAPTKTEPPK